MSVENIIFFVNSTFLLFINIAPCLLFVRNGFQFTTLQREKLASVDNDESVVTEMIQLFCKLHKKRIDIREMSVKFVIRGRFQSPFLVR